MISLARKPRVYFPGAIYHVICRGNNKEWIFNTDLDKRSYLSLIGQYKERYGFKLYAWAILSNHVHLLIKVNDVPLSKIMQGIQQSYTGRYNHFNKRTGHVFEQRYKAFLCYDDTHLLSVIRYIHYNPLRAGLEGGLNHSYCSHKDYMSRQPARLTDTEYPLQLFASERKTAIQVYREFMAQDDQMFNPEQVPPVDDGQREPRPAFRDQEIIKVPLLELVIRVAELCNVASTNITGQSRQREVVAARRVLVQFCVNHTLISQGQLVTALGFSDSTVSKAANFRSEDVSENVSKLLNKLKSKA